MKEGYHKKHSFLFIFDNLYIAMQQLSLLFIIACIIDLSNAQGASWTEEETRIIKQKLFRFMDKTGLVTGEYIELHPGYEGTIKAQHGPSVKKILRLGFHDCLTYSDDLDQDEVNGCDGCLSSVGMNLDMYDDFNITAHARQGPNVNVTNNNGLGVTADILEEIFTNPDFPRTTPSLAKSMKSSGKSRADLWAFASLLALKNGVDNNNQGCDGKQCHLHKNEPGCRIEWPSIPKFRTGRRDCDTPNDAVKPWHAKPSRHENHPSPHGNGPETIDFFKEHFDMNSRETIALIGGKLHSLQSYLIII